MTSRDTEEFAALWAKSHSTIAAFVRSLTPNFDQAEEILQRVAVTLVRKFSDYDRKRPFSAWAVGVAKNEVLYYRRQRATDKHMFDDELVSQVAMSYQVIAEDDPAKEILAGCLEQVTGRARQALWLRYFNGFSSDKIAAEMELSSGAVRMLLCRTRSALRECIERQLAPGEVS